MKVSANYLLYEFNRRFKAQKSRSSNSLQIIEAVSYLNEALQIWYENRVKLRELNDSIRNSLRVYEVKHKKIKVEEVDINVSKFKYPKDFYAKTTIEIEATNSECCEGIVKFIEPTIVQSDDLQKTRRNSYQRSDFKWERLLADEAGDSMYLYHDQALKPEKAILSYMRLPQMLQAPELCSNVYEDYDGKLITKNVDLEVDNTFDSRHIVDIAVLCASRDTLNSEEFNLQLQKIFNISKL